MKDFEKIASFYNPEIKVLSYRHGFDFPDVTMTFDSAVNIPIEDKNIIPVAVRVSMLFPTYNAVGANAIIGNGVHISATLNLRNVTADIIWEVHPNCSSNYAPVWKQELFGDVARPLSENNGNLALDFIMSNLNLIPFGETISGHIVVDFYYIPIRY